MTFACWPLTAIKSTLTILSALDQIAPVNFLLAFFSICFFFFQSLPPARNPATNQACQRGHLVSDWTRASYSNDAVYKQLRRHDVFCLVGGSCRRLVTGWKSSHLRESCCPPPEPRLSDQVAHTHTHTHLGF